MQTYHVRLISEIFKTYRCQRAANSLDIDVEKKSIHELKITADLTSPFNIGLILGSSGSGKTTLAKKIFGDDIFKSYIDLSKPVIDQFPQELDYDTCSQLLAGVGLTAVPCWIRPAYTLSNGQRARAEAALAMCQNQEIIVIDEWTSVVDRTVAKVMSHCIQKAARKLNKKVILLSCHYDVTEWLNPDFIIDCNEEKFIDRRLLQPDQRKRTEQLTFTIREVPRSTWKNFSKYHYLSDQLPGGKTETYGIFHENNQIGFQAFTNYVPRRKPWHKMQMHINRTVIHPDYAGLGLGIKLMNQTAQMMALKNYDVRIKFSSIPVLKAMQKDPKWKLIALDTPIGLQKGTSSSLGRNKTKTTDGGFRKNCKTYSFKYIGNI
jgi:ABC-type Mn2+/Zn2+ transport system ATPase subunit